MESGEISDGQISASSSFGADYVASRGRLHTQVEGNLQGAWSAFIPDANQWIQIDLGDQYPRVTGVATQGRSVIQQWVTKYQLKYSNDGVSFDYYKEQGQVTGKVHELTFLSIFLNKSQGRPLFQIWEARWPNG